MPFDPTLYKGYSPTLEEFLEDVGVESPGQVREVILKRCKQLHDLASQKGEIKDYGTPYEFINCDSSEFYQTLVNMGYGNAALTIDDEVSYDVYFLMFTDKVPSKLRPIVASHEATEYSKFQQGIEQSVAHLAAQVLEPEIAESLGLKKEYLDFLQQNHPGKFEEMKNLGLF
jgi:hypothetical protein